MIRTITIEQEKASERRSELLINNEIDFAKAREIGKEKTFAQFMQQNWFQLTDSRKLDGVYKTQCGNYLLVYVSHGWIYRYWLLSPEEMSELQGIQGSIPAPQNVYFEF